MKGGLGCHLCCGVQGCHRESMILNRCVGLWKVNRELGLLIVRFKIEWYVRVIVARSQL